MWCKSCNLETNEDRCPICGIETVEDVPVEIYWCDNCSVPLIHISTAAEKGVCPLCGNKTHYLSSDLRPGYDYAVKVRTTNVADHDDLHRMAGYQIRKFNACRKCLKCESICRQGAISIIGDSYYIDPDKCVHCKMCMTAKYLDGGCMMDKYLRTK